MLINLKLWFIRVVYTVVTIVKGKLSVPEKSTFSRKYLSKYKQS